MSGMQSQVSTLFNSTALNLSALRISRRVTELICYQDSPNGTPVNPSPPPSLLSSQETGTQGSANLRSTSSGCIPTMQS